MLTQSECEAHEVGLFGRVARKKPYVNKINRGKRFRFAREILAKPLRYWENVVWTDESKFNLFGSDGKLMLWRTPQEEVDPKCAVLTVKHSGGSVVVWGCFIRKGTGKLYVLDRIMDRHYYRDILEQNLLPSIDHFQLGTSARMEQNRAIRTWKTSRFSFESLIRMHQKRRLSNKVLNMFHNSY